MIALITGGSGGIGQACARTLLEQGYIVYLAARNSARLEAAAEQLKPSGGKLETLVLDVGVQAQVDESIEQIFECHQRLDILVHAAGQSGHSALDAPDNPQLWHTLLQTHLNGGYYCSRAAALKMKQNQWGRIIHIASVLGLRGMRHSSAYCAAKHGLIGLTRALAQELLEFNITVNALCPGWVDTAMAKQDMAELAQNYGLNPTDFEAEEIRATPLGRWIRPEEVASLVAYLVSPGAGALTGQALEMSGGL